MSILGPDGQPINSGTAPPANGQPQGLPTFRFDDHTFVFNVLPIQFLEVKHLPSGQVVAVMPPHPIFGVIDLFMVYLAKKARDGDDDAVGVLSSMKVTLHDVSSPRRRYWPPQVEEEKECP